MFDERRRCATAVAFQCDRLVVAAHRRRWPLLGRLRPTGGMTAIEDPVSAGNHPWDSDVLHPYSHYLANKICERMAEVRKSGLMPWLRPDCKS